MASGHSSAAPESHQRITYAGGFHSEDGAYSQSVSVDVSGARECAQTRHGREMGGSEEVPGDIRAFYGHPLNAASDSVNANGLALLHEYRFLSAIDTDDKYDQKLSAMDLMGYNSITHASDHPSTQSLAQSRLTNSESPPTDFIHNSESPLTDFIHNSESPPTDFIHNSESPPTDFIHHNESSPSDVVVHTSMESVPTSELLKNDFGRGFDDRQIIPHSQEIRMNIDHSQTAFLVTSIHAPICHRSDSIVTSSNVSQNINRSINSMETTTRFLPLNTISQSEHPNISHAMNHDFKHQPASRVVASERHSMADEFGHNLTEGDGRMACTVKTEEYRSSDPVAIGFVGNLQPGHIYNPDLLRSSVDMLQDKSWISTNDAAEISLTTGTVIQKNASRKRRKSTTKTLKSEAFPINSITERTHYKSDVVPIEQASSLWNLSEMNNFDARNQRMFFLSGHPPSFFSKNSKLTKTDNLVANSIISSHRDQPTSLSDVNLAFGNFNEHRIQGIAVQTGPDISHGLNFCSQSNDLLHTADAIVNAPQWNTKVDAKWSSVQNSLTTPCSSATKMHSVLAAPEIPNVSISNPQYLQQNNSGESVKYINAPHTHCLPVSSLLMSTDNKRRPMRKPKKKKVPTATLR